VLSVVGFLLVPVTGKKALEVNDGIDL
jgi:hypothetical protein